MTDGTITGLLAAAEPAERVPLAGLIQRLGADGGLRGAREGDKADRAGGARRAFDRRRDR